MKLSPIAGWLVLSGSPSRFALTAMFAGVGGRGHDSRLWRIGAENDGATRLVLATRGINIRDSFGADAVDTVNIADIK